MTTAQQTPEEQFLDETLELAGFDPEEDDFELLKEDLRPLLEERVMLKLYAALPTEEDRAAFDKLLDESEEGEEEGDEVFAFLSEKIGNVEEYIVSIYTEFQTEYLEAMKDTE
ncbi:MAG: hypothetical protein PHU61_01870 [Candidatus Absconditabacteria bacterium]|nr:hypothetical protein [Candidatus Absconditabacteria bacterium]MDD3868457.1 hypothetical protein [Candidatus Absconditabacteria bacterium]MDD4713969.1 hypothetical protein [Candidatus Absconditabacteria bacterium]